MATALQLELEKKCALLLRRVKVEISSLRTGRISSSLIEDIAVDYYGTKTPLKALASFSSPEPRQILIQPFDKNATEAIQKAIFASPLGLNPIAERDALRIAVPALTEERKQELVKVLKKKIEEIKIQLRQERDHAMKSIQTLEKEKAISEDEKFRFKQGIEKIIDETGKKIDETSAHKEREIMTG